MVIKHRIKKGYVELPPEDAIEGSRIGKILQATRMKKTHDNLIYAPVDKRFKYDLVRYTIRMICEGDVITFIDEMNHENIIKEVSEKEAVTRGI
jgi:hypothetical protein